MPKWMKTILALLAGTFAGGGTIALVEMIGHKAAEGETLFGIAAAGLGIAAFVGGAISNLIDKTNILPWVIAAILAALSVMNVMSFKHPGWFIPVGFALLALGAWLSIQVTKSKGKLS